MNTNGYGKHPNAVCPRRVCTNFVGSHPALSRADNVTEICSECGTREAMECLQLSRKGESREAIVDFLLERLDK
jgi:hypothetical protein